MAVVSAPPPGNNPMIDRADLTVTRPWYQWLIALIDRVDNGARRVAVERVSAQAASIGTTALPIGLIAGGLYRVSWALRVTQAATSSSSLTVGLSWTDGTIACSLSGAAVTGNTTATTQSGTALIQVDQGTPVSYSTTYASSGATPMQYQVEIVLEQVS